MTPAPEKAAPIPADVERTLSGEKVLGFHVAAYRETHPIDGAAYGHKYSEHWSTPNTRDPRVKVERLFTEEQLRAALADREARPSLPDSREEQIREDDGKDLLDLEWVDMPSYGMMSFDQLREAVSEAIIGDRHHNGPFDPSYSRGHQQVGGCNYNSLNRIVTAFVLADRSRARQGGNNG